MPRRYKKRTVKRPNQWFTPENAKKVVNAAGVAQKLYSKFTANPAVKKEKSGLRRKKTLKDVKIKHEKMNGGGQVICTTVNIG